jgi:hypothetical protein
MRDVICPECGGDLGEAESDESYCGTCPYCYHYIENDPEEDPAEMYARQEEEERNRLIPDRADTPRLPN